ncbi:MAG: HIT domain-containing protein, partial [Nitrososphaeraceae archaeon]
MDSKCIFCKIILGNLPSNIIVQDEKAIAFLDAFPLTKGHTLVIPKMHFSKTQDMTEEYGSALFR